MMKYIKVGRSGLKVSELSFGCWQIGLGKPSESESIDLIHSALDSGINSFDTADNYGFGISETVLGKALKGRREHVVVATKCKGKMGEEPNNEGLSRFHIIRSVEKSLARLKMDYIDIYQAHSWDKNTPIDETLRAFDDLVRQGKILYLGCSNFNAWQLTKSLFVSDKNLWSRFICVQPNYSLVNRMNEKELLPLCLDQSIGVFPYSPLAGGFLSGKYKSGKFSKGRIQDFVKLKAMNEQYKKLLDLLAVIAKNRNKTVSQVALRWVMDHPAVVSAVIGASNISQLKENLGSMGWSLDPKEYLQLDQASTPPF